MAAYLEEALKLNTPCVNFLAVPHFLLPTNDLLYELLHSLFYRK